MAVTDRVRLLREGVVSKDGRLVANGATTWKDGPIPLLVLLSTEGDGHYGARLCGAVRHIWRESDGSGWITGVLDTTLNTIGLHCEADMDRLDMPEAAGEEMVFTHVRLRAVTLAQGNAIWSDMTIEAETDDDN